jgi:tetratricopeptide (TPR) repeat protein
LVLFEKSDQTSGDRTGRLRRAVQLLERADQLSPPPQYVLHLRRLAWCQLHLRRPDEALQACRRMLTQSRLSNDKALHREAVRFTAAVLALAEQSPGLGRITTSWQLNEIEPELHPTFRDDVDDFLQQRLEGDKLAQILPEPIGHERDLLLRTLDGSSSGAAEPNRARGTQATAQRGPFSNAVENRGN